MHELPEGTPFPIPLEAYGPPSPDGLLATLLHRIDANPFNVLDFGKLDLWTWDQYHASAEGYYLESLVVFGRITGDDPVTLGPREQAADDLGLSPTTAAALQRNAHDELAAR